MYLDSNITGTYNVIEASHKIKVKHLIMASSSSVYGSNQKIPFKETDKTETQLSIYAATKKSNESMAHAYSNIWKIPITMLRFFTVHGPWEDLIWHYSNLQKEYKTTKKLMFIIKVGCTEILLILMTL
jgi:nucleoside-diphosphate-sugar epimerase